MRFTFTKEQNEFRKEVQDFLKAELPETSPKAGGLSEIRSVEFSQKMGKKGWIGMTWPKEFGGQGRTYVEKAILMEELFRAQAPLGHHFMADRQIGPAIIHFGSQWQKEHFLPRIVKGEPGISFCLLFSEPNAGSDLVAVATKAIKDGDDYVVSGQKVWTSGGHTADYGWLLAVTNFDSSVPKHMACSQFIFDMKAPGVTVRPIINSVGHHSFNEVFMDEVRVSKKFMVGKDGDGFKQIMAQMDYERAGLERLMQNYPLSGMLKGYIKQMGQAGPRDDFYGWARDSLAQMEIEYNIGRLFCYYTAWTIDQGRTPTKEAAMAKAYCTQYEQRLNDVAMRVLGPASQIRPGVKWAPFEGYAAEAYLWGPSYTLQGGTVEVLKNIIAQRGLGLPKK